MYNLTLRRVYRSPDPTLRTDVLADDFTPSRWSQQQQQKQTHLLQNLQECMVENTLQRL